MDARDAGDNMITHISGRYEGKTTRVTVEDGEIVGDRPMVALAALGAVRASAEVSIPGVWAGIASLDDPWALRALFAELLEPGTARFSGDESPALAAVIDPNAVY